MKYKNTITPKNIFMIALIVAIIYLLTCHHKKQPTIPNVIPTTVQRDSVRVDSIASKHFVDSVTQKLKYATKEGEMWYNEWVASEGRYNDLEKGVSEFAQQPVPDTCKELQKNYITQLAKLSKENKSKDTYCFNAIAAKEAIMKQQNAIIIRYADDNKKLKTRFDTALAQQDKLTAAIQKVKNKREVYAGIMAMGSEQKVFEGTGVNVGYRNKKGNQYDVFAMQINSGLHYGVSFKKKLFSF